MKIQLDQNGKSIASETLVSRATGLLLTRKGQRMQVDIGNRATPQALFSALSHLRSVQCYVYFSTAKESEPTTLPLNKKLTASEACYYLSLNLLRAIEQRHQIFESKSLTLLSKEVISKLPAPLQNYANLRMQNMETSAALSLLDENAMHNASFILPSADLNYNDASYRVGKLPTKLHWPVDSPYLPLTFREILTPSHAAWYNSLAHIALCVRRPLIHRCQMRLLLKKPAQDANNPLPDNLESAAASPAMHPSDSFAIPANPSWHMVTRILYPFASDIEKPINFSLLICSSINKQDHIIL